MESNNLYVTFHFIIHSLTIAAACSQLLVFFVWPLCIGNWGKVFLWSHTLGRAINFLGHPIQGDVEYQPSLSSGADPEKKEGVGGGGGGEGALNLG